MADILEKIQKVIKENTYFDGEVINDLSSKILSAIEDEITEITTTPVKKTLYYISCSTGCSCCAENNFDQGFYLTSEEPNKIVEKWSMGIGNPLASQFAKFGRYRVNEVEAEILPDGRVIVEDSIFDKEVLEWAQTLNW